MKQLLDIVDERLDWWVSRRLNTLPVFVPPDMATGESDGDWKVWIPVQSRVTDQDLEEVENKLGCKLSPQYRALLRHKHFMELQIGAVATSPRN